MTQEKEGVASAEADKSYEIEEFKLSVEVNFTSGDAAKLDRYQALGMHEVWIWEDGVLAIYHLRAGKYEKVNRSRIPALEAIPLNILGDNFFDEILLNRRTGVVQLGHL